MSRGRDEARGAENTRQLRKASVPCGEAGIPEGPEQLPVVLGRAGEASRAPHGAQEAWARRCHRGLRTVSASGLQPT